MAASPAGPNNLPLQATHLVGRECDAGDVLGLVLRPDVRLLTLTGPAGVGKTRLAIEAASQALGAFRDGAFFVDLAPVEDPALVVSAIARTLAVQEGSGQPMLAQVGRYLAAKQMLLVLDNFEQVTDAARDVGELLASCPELTVLATSRTLLHLRWEHQFPVPALVVPDLDRLWEPDVLAAATAVTLFVERARALRPEFAISADNGGTLAEICRRLDGLPLAIELSAAQMDVLPPPLILDGLRRSGLDLLGESAVDLPARHRTLRAAIGWSDRLLDTDDRLLFRRLSVFVGGWTRDAGEAVCANPIPPAERPIDVGRGLASLIRKNLLRIDAVPGDAPSTGLGRPSRLRMLEMVREYALEQLRQSGAEPALRRRHRDWCLAMAEEADARIRTAEQPQLLDRLEAEHDNLRTALAWCQRDPESVAVGLRLAGALAWFWRLRGHISEGRGWLGAALGSNAEGSSEARPRALNGAALLSYALGDYAGARVLLEESLALADELGDGPATAWARHGLGRMAHAEGDYESARVQLELSLTHFDRAGDRAGRAYSVLYLATVARDRCDYDVSLALFREGQALAREAGDSWGLSFGLAFDGDLACLQGQPERAVPLYREAMSLARAIRAKWLVAHCLKGMTGAAGALGLAERAARLYGAERALNEELGTRMPGDQSAYERSLAAARAALGEAPFAAAAVVGRAMTVAEVVAYALADESRPLPVEAPVAASVAPLTRREREVAALVARGLTNRQIADHMVVGVRTAESHVASALGKLALSTRSQLASWATTHGLEDARGP